jgi:hypothetical protein
MIGSTTPLGEPLRSHPVHRADALLRAALLNSTQPSPSLAGEQLSLESLSGAIATVMEGPVAITFPRPLAARLAALAVDEDSPAAFDVLMHGAPGGARSPSAHEGDYPNEADEDSWGPGELTIEAPLDPERRIVPTQVHVQSLMQEFQRRQRHASLLVAGSIATAALLTVGGLLLIASLSAPAAGDNRPPSRSTSVAWQRPVLSQPRLQVATVSANRAAKSEPLVVPALSDIPASGSEPANAPQLILTASGRQISFATLLPPNPAGYLLIRGLPREATLSAGRRSESGTWLVKGAYVHDLVLTLGNAAEGDYPVEVYVLQSGDTPQARRNLVLRVEDSTPVYPVAVPDWGWATALFDIVPAAQAAEMPTAPAEPAVLRGRAKQLLEEGDIAAARLLLLHLAERGEGEAAYDLGRTFDREMLAALGAKGVEGDLARARGWYERASRDGNAQAAERLKVLASLSDSRPSD